MAAHHRDELNPQASVNGTREAWPRNPEAGEEEEENNLDSSMGIGPVSHRSLASSGLAAASDAAAVSQKSLRAGHMSGKSFGSSGGTADAKTLLA